MTETDFLEWIVGTRIKIGGLFVGLIYIVVTVLSTRYFSDQLPRWQQVILTTNPGVPSALQCLALLPLLLVCPMVKLPPLEGNYRLAIEACKQFRDPWSLLIFMWFLFYLLLLLRQLDLIGPNWVPWIDLVNNLQGVCLFACYWILTAKTLKKERGEPDQDGGRVVRPLWHIYSMLLWALVLFLILDLQISTTTAYSPTPRAVFQFLSGLWVGVSLSLLIGCLESQFLGQPRRLTLVLYLYAVLQLAYVGFNGVQGSVFLQEVATITSLPLKLLFIAFWYWALQSGLLAFYMKETRDIIDHVPSQWASFSKSVREGTPLDCVSDGEVATVRPT